MGLAEDTGLVLPLGEWVLERACRTARAWADAHPGQTAVMAVNLSARQFLDPDLCDRVSAVLQAVGLEPSSLVLEITETVVMGDTERTLATLRALKRLGVRLAIDDFGTGYSSLSYLKRFPVDVVKIDKSFVDGLGDTACWLKRPYGPTAAGVTTRRNRLPGCPSTPTPCCCRSRRTCWPRSARTAAARG